MTSSGIDVPRGTSHLNLAARQDELMAIVPELMLTCLAITRGLRANRTIAEFDMNLAIPVKRCIFIQNFPQSCQPETGLDISKLLATGPVQRLHNYVPRGTFSHQSEPRNVPRGTIFHLADQMNVPRGTSSVARDHKYFINRRCTQIHADCNYQTTVPSFLISTVCIRVHMRLIHPNNSPTRTMFHVEHCIKYKPQHICLIYNRYIARQETSQKFRANDTNALYLQMLRQITNRENSIQTPRSTPGQITLCN